MFKVLKPHVEAVFNDMHFNGGGCATKAAPRINGTPVFETLKGHPGMKKLVETNLTGRYPTWAFDSTTPVRSLADIEGIMGRSFKPNEWVSVDWSHLVQEPFEGWTPVDAFANASFQITDAVRADEAAGKKPALISFISQLRDANSHGRAITFADGTKHAYLLRSLRFDVNAGPPMLTDTFNHATVTGFEAAIAKHSVSDQANFLSSFQDFATKARAAADEAANAGSATQASLERFAIKTEALAARYEIKLAEAKGNKKIADANDSLGWRVLTGSEG